MRQDLRMSMEARNGRVFPEQEPSPCERKKYKSKSKSNTKNEHDKKIQTVNGLGNPNGQVGCERRRPSVNPFARIWSGYIALDPMGVCTENSPANTSHEERCKLAKIVQQLLQDLGLSSQAQWISGHIITDMSAEALLSHNHEQRQQERRHEIHGEGDCDPQDSLVAHRIYDLKCLRVWFHFRVRWHNAKRLRWCIDEWSRPFGILGLEPVMPSARLYPTNCDAWIACCPCNNEVNQRRSQNLVNAQKSIQAYVWRCGRNGETNTFSYQALHDETRPFSDMASHPPSPATLDDESCVPVRKVGRYDNDEQNYHEDKIRDERADVGMRMQPPGGLHRRVNDHTSDNVTLDSDEFLGSFLQQIMKESGWYEIPTANRCILMIPRAFLLSPPRSRAEHESFGFSPPAKRVGSLASDARDNDLEGPSTWQVPTPRPRTALAPTQPQLMTPQGLGEDAALPSPIKAFSPGWRSLTRRFLLDDLGFPSSISRFT